MLEVRSPSFPLRHAVPAPVAAFAARAFLAIPVAIAAAGCKGGSSGPGATSLDPPAGPEPTGEAPGFPFVAHVDQRDITERRILFEELFVLGDELFEAEFNGLDGVGVHRLPDGTVLPGRFARSPPGGGRFTGPNAQACAGCHNTPFPTSAGEAASNVQQDPAGAGVPPFNARNPTHLFGAAVLQRLAEEITEELLATRDAAVAAAEPGGPPVERRLVAKGIDYGTISVARDASGTLTVDTSAVRGVDADLVVRPYGWKGDVTTLRDFCRRAAMNELGMEPDELVARDPQGRADPDGDGVEGELSVGDVTAIAVYVGAQPVPRTRAFLVREGLAPPPSAEAAEAARRGETLFAEAGCTACHIPELRLEDPVFEEPTARGGGHYFDPAIDPEATWLDPSRPHRVHLVREGDPPRLAPHPAGGARAAIYGDLRRHRMGRRLADPQPTPARDASAEILRVEGEAVQVGRSVFLTAELWGVGNTGPWLHDGRAATLEEAILLHGEEAPPPVGDPGRSEAQEARDAFAALPDDDRRAVVEFLRSLVLVSFEGED